MLRFVLPLLLLASALPLSARELKDLAYVIKGTPAQTLDLYLPEEGSPARPLIVWIHGGGWRGGSKNKFPARPLLDQGFAVASVEYRFSQAAKFPAQIEDCKAAIRWLRAHAKEYGLQPDHIGVWGASAGGHLVSLLGTTSHLKDFDVGENLEQSSQVQCVVDWYGPVDFMHWGEKPVTEMDRADSAVTQLLGATATQNPDKAKRASPAAYVQKDAAPFLIMHGDKDPVVPVQQSKLMDELLTKAGVESTFIVLPGAAHGGAQFYTPANAVTVATFFKRHLLKQ